MDSHLDRDMADSTFRSVKDCEQDQEYMFQTYSWIISFVFTGEDDDEALRRARNACENLQVIKLDISLGEGRISVQASGVHDSRHDTLRADDEGRVEGWSHTYQHGIGESQVSRGRSMQIYRDERDDC